MNTESVRARDCCTRYPVGVVSETRSRIVSKEIIIKNMTPCTCNIL